MHTNSVFLLACSTVVLLLCQCSPGIRGESSVPSYAFEGSISEEVLRNYLSRAVTHAEFAASPELTQDGPNLCVEDDMRMLQELGAKFVGRALFRWGSEHVLNHPDFFSYARERIAHMHAYDADVIFQASVFEIVTRRVNEVLIPSQVLDAFAQPPDPRPFRYEDMINEQGYLVDHWNAGSSVPDISRLETRMWFYYLATRYIDAGFEAIHWGQVNLIGMNDPDLLWWQELLQKVRSYAADHARRGYLISDAHAQSRGYKVADDLLFDFHSFPLRVKDVPEEHLGGKLEAGHLDSIYLRSKGGRTPSGWMTESLPYLVEFDNYGVRPGYGEPNEGDYFVWGYDEITWFALKEPWQQAEWLRYAWNWLAKTDEAGYLQMPTQRTISRVIDRGSKYQANRASEACPGGSGLEHTIAALWSEAEVQ